ncbi:MAG: hypothetical protein JSS66_05485 [Armatimonadetes bacterium]|nr:hypothetical protein [Armatimonadota bacterium]
MADGQLPLYENSASLEIEDRGPRVVIKPDVTLYLKFNGVRIPIVSDLEEVLAELDRADGYFERVVLYDSELAKALETAGLVVRNSRGSYRGAQLLSDAKDEIQARLSEARKYEPNVTWEPTDDAIEALPEALKQFVRSLQSSEQP